MLSISRALLWVTCTWSAGVCAASLTVAVTDAASSQPLADTVVYAVSTAKAPMRAGKAAIAQVERRFVPYVTVVQTGTPIEFPNRDSVKHHVYSFSPAKTFELKLYAGTPAVPVMFDKPGLVTLGCNIHDHMLAFVAVVDTPYFAKTEAAGTAVLEGLPPGDYVVHVWHPDAGIALGADSGRAVTMAGDAASSMAIRLAVTPGSARH